MEIKFYNNLTNRLENFQPIFDKKVLMYVCGITTYNDPHIGNLRPVIVFDTLVRFLSYLGYEVEYTRNYTDIDDRIIQKALEEHISEMDVSDRYIKSYEESVNQVQALLPTHRPRVSDYIPQIIEFIKRLIELNAAYVVAGDVYFRVSKIKDYGRLSKINLEDLQVGARVEENRLKENPLDFALWKKTTVGINFTSPWSQGRPGWHTECVVMVNSIYQSPEIDIHGGGLDLKFPHHENEIAQSLAFQNTPLARFWLHNGFVNLKNEKMSKSLGNILSAKEAITLYGGLALRLWMLGTHYRLPLSFSEESLFSSQKEIEKLRQTLKKAAVHLQLNHEQLIFNNIILSINFLKALSQDLNTPNALTEVFALSKEINKLLKNAEVSLEELKTSFASLLKMLEILGLSIEYPFLNEEDYQLYKAYLKAKEEKDFQTSDTLRQKLMAKNIL